MSSLVPTKNFQEGFTLLEILVVFGMLAILAAFTMYMSMDSYRGYSFRTERDSLVSVLQNARGQAMNNICQGVSCDGGMSHGVHIENGKYIIFQGTTYNSSDSNNQTIYAGTNSINVIGNDVVFEQLSGDCKSVECSSGTLQITLSGQGKSSTITVNNQGLITWSD